MRTLLIAAVLALSTPALADETITIINPHAYESVASVRAAGAFITIENHGDTDEVLLSAHTDAAGKTELHTIIDENGVKKMRAVQNMPIPAHSTLTLARGGDHIMFIGLKYPLKAGENLPLRLEFENAGTRDVMVNVIAQGDEIGHDHGHAHH